MSETTRRATPLRRGADNGEQFTLTMQAASRFSNLSVRTLQRFIGKGLLKSRTLGRRRLVFRDSLISLLEKGA